MRSSRAVPRSSDEEVARLRDENQSLRAQLDECQETLRAIQAGAVDALVIDTPDGERVFTLQGGEHPYRALIEQMREGAVTLAHDGVVHYCNRSFAELVKLPLESIMGCPILRFIAPGDRALINSMLQGGGGRAELAIMASDGIETPVLASAISLRTEGPAAICLVASDLTERKRHESVIHQLNEELEQRVVERTAQLAAAKDLLAVTLASIGDGVIVTDAKGKITFLNREAESLTGWTSGEAEGRALSDVFHIVKEDGRTPIEDPVDMVLRVGSVVGRAHDTLLIARDGRETVIDDRGAPIRQGDGTVHGVVLVFRDYSEQKQIETTLQRAKVDAEAANQAKSRFVANISHELRTPMNAILGLINLVLQHKTTDPTARDLLKTAGESADLLLALLNDLLDSAKVEAGKLELDAAPFSLRRVLDQTTQVLAVRASEKGIAFACHVSRDIPDTLVGDDMRLRQVLLNLAGNGIKFTEQGRVTINVNMLGDSQPDGSRSDQQIAKTTCPCDCPNPIEPRHVTLKFSIRDTGIGLRPSDLQHIFQPFSQADASTTRHFGGSGLGLSISQGLVAMMGGHIWAKSQPGHGSTFEFTIRLPLSDEAPAAPSVRLPVATTAPAKLRVLLVEDNPANQKFANYLLQDRGHCVDVANDGHQAIALTLRNDYDVILMDLQMPGIDGVDTMGAIRASEPPDSHIPIVAMTAHAMKGDRERCLAAGMDDYVSKPINAAEMIALVERLGCERAALCDKPKHSRSDAHRKRPTTSIFNPDVAMKRCLNKRDLLQEMVAFFLEDANTILPAIRTALQNGDWIELGRLGHRMKGTLLHLGAKAATDAAAAVEQFMLRRENSYDTAEIAVRTLERECTILRVVLDDFESSLVPSTSE